jgi:hypothetical protein
MQATNCYMTTQSIAYIFHQKILITALTTFALDIIGHLINQLDTEPRSASDNQG